jgi:predicted extracellular nuclease
MQTKELRKSSSSKAMRNAKFRMQTKRGNTNIKKALNCLNCDRHLCFARIWRLFMRKIPLILFVCALFVVSTTTACVPANPSETPIVPTSLIAESTQTPVAALPTMTPLPEGPSIAELQGAGHHSPYRNDFVENVLGIVTTFSGAGFYMQSPEPDDDPATSEGIFVSKPGLQKVKPGDLVLVSGKVIERYPDGGQGGLSITEITFTEYEILSSGNPLPEPVLLGGDGRQIPSDIIDNDQLDTFDPEQDGLDFYESLESMLVQISDPIAVGGISQYRELPVVADLGAQATGLSERGTLVISADDYNPERILVDDALRSLSGDITLGSRPMGELIGVIDYTFGMYKLQPIAKTQFIYGEIKDDFAPKASESDLTIAAYNVENLDAGDSEERFTTFADHVVNHLFSPDIIILSEVQDNNGEEQSDSAEADLTGAAMINAIISAGGPQYAYVDVAPKYGADGGAPGGNIRVGFLYREDRGISLVDHPAGDATTAVQAVAVDGRVTLSHNPARIDPENFVFRSSRKPLIGEFIYQGNTIFVIGMHMNSKGEDTPLFGERQPPRLDSERQRIQQAEVIYDFILTLLAIDPAANIIVAGDLNDFPFSAPIQTLQGEALYNLMDELPPNERYTYIYEGNAQVLDQILISQSLRSRINYFAPIHLNSELPADHRFSDHDPVYLCLNFED